jgi:NAD(P)-dependent dehydrogenase (short-subunit alcohol dehydrogenase family)
MTIRFDGRVAIVTGAGNGLGRSHALELARLGAKVVVNDFGGSRDGKGGSISPAETVASEIRASGGEAIANGANVAAWSDCVELAAQAVAEWGRIDILINNAGNLRDRSFGKMSADDWRSVIDVHLNGTAFCSMAVWNRMKQQNYGRILMTASSSGTYGNFGQANYGAAKMGVIGLMNTLVVEGAKYGIRINCIAPTAATRMTEDIMTPDMLERLKPEFVTPAAVFLVSEDCPDRTVMFAGAGRFSSLEMRESRGARLPPDQRTADGVAAHFAEISRMDDALVFTAGLEHVMQILDLDSSPEKD